MCFIAPPSGFTGGPAEENGVTIIISAEDNNTMSSRSGLIIPAIIIVFAVAAALVLNPMTQNDDRDSGQSHTFPGPVEEENRAYPPASVAEESFVSGIDTLRSSLTDPTLDADAMAAAIRESNDMNDRIHEWYVWIQLDYYEKPAEYRGEYEAWSVFIDHAYGDYAAVVKESLSGPCADTVEKALTLCDINPDRYRNAGSTSLEKKTDLAQREVALLADYTSLMTGDYEMTYGGSTWTLDSIYGSDTLSDSRKEELAAMLREERYQDAAEIYVGLVEVRNDIAVLNGYGNYAEYCYREVAGRDYTPAEAKSLADLAAPAKEIFKLTINALGSDGPMSSSRLTWTYELEGNEIIDAAEPFIDSMGDEFERLLDHMVEYDLIDICDEDGRIRTSYTSKLYYSGGAVIYMGSEEEGSEYNALRVLTHEFGHASADSLNPNLTGCIDVMEIHSQGLEVLFGTSGLDGNDSSDAMCAYALYLLSHNIFISWMMTELELWAYETEAATDSLTADQVCDRFLAIQDQFGVHFDIEFGGKYYWIDFSNLFTIPNYYVSYCTSSVGAIELFVEATEDYDAAKEKYLNLLFQQNIYGYSAAIKEAGLTNAFDTEAAKAILEKCIAVIKDTKGV